MLNLKMKRKNVIWLSAVILGLLMLSFSLLNNMSNMDGAAYLKVVDEKGSELKDVLIIPLYSSKSFWLRFGPDGKGFSTPAYLVIKNPFLFNSGENLISKKIPSKGIFLSPFGKTSPLFAGIGYSNYIHAWLFMKKGFIPKYFNQNDIFERAPIVMIKSSENENARVIDLLLAPKYDQNILKKEFKLDWVKEEITVVFDEKEITLLKYTNK